MTTVPNPQVVDWLLEGTNPSIRYRTLREILDKAPDDPEVLATKAVIPSSPPVAAIFAQMDPAGIWYALAWRKIDVGHGVIRRKKIQIGDGVDYQDFYTTHFNLAYLAELGMDRGDVRIELAVNRYLALQQTDGDFAGHMSCLYAYNLRTLTMLGYGADARVQRIVALLTGAGRGDGGYLCDTLEGKYPDKPTKSCIRGSVKALLAFAEYSQLWDMPACQALVAYFLTRHGLFKSTARHFRKPLLDELGETLFPFTWRATNLEILLALSKMGHGNHPSLRECWAMLARARDEDGRYRLTQMNQCSHFIPTRQGEPCKWITFYALLAQKYQQIRRGSDCYTSDPCW